MQSALFTNKGPSDSLPKKQINKTKNNESWEKGRKHNIVKK